MDYEIAGMRCAGCASRIERVLKKVAGDEVVVNFATHRARVQDAVASSVVVAAVEKLGYQATPVVPATPTAKTVRSRQGEAARRDLVVSFVFGLPVLALGMLHLDFAGNGAIQAVLTLLVLALPGRQFFVRAVKGLRHGIVGMDTLVALGCAAAFGASLASLIAGRHEYYFEAAAMIVSFILLGRHLEERARGASLDAIDRLRGLAAKQAVLLDEAGGERSVDVAAIKAGDRIVIRPGEKVPVDAVIIDGGSTFDESLVTGEAVPVAKTAGDPLLGATLNTGFHRVVARATAGTAGSVVARIAGFVEAAQASKAQMQRLADRIALYFVPTVLVLAALTLLVWRFGLGVDGGIALKNAIAVLVIACPCALGLATPMAMLVATGAAARKLILIRGAPGLERIGKLRTLVVDKTGTLTKGRPHVVTVLYEPGIEERLALAAAAAAERSSLHPIAMALIVHAEERGLRLPAPSFFEERPGLGVRAVVDAVDCLVGSLQLMRGAGVALPSGWLALEHDERSTVYVALDGKPAAAFVIDDELRPAAQAAMAALRKLGVRVVMATGDREAPARRVAQVLGIDEVHAGVQPEGKVALLRALKRRGEAVGMVGDGVNDAPALAEADVGIAIGTGADVAIDAALVVLPQGDLGLVAEAVSLSSRTVTVMRQNLAWAFMYNAFALPLAAFGKLSPMIASAAMALSSLSVVLNSLRLRGRGP
jgi:Cu+-exporting ATPase